MLGGSPRAAEELGDAGGWSGGESESAPEKKGADLKLETIGSLAIRVLTRVLT